MSAFVQFTEIAMLVLFGLSWPFNIAKSYKSRTTKGKSLIFELCVIAGYIFGVAGKLVTYATTGVFAYSIWFYFADIAMVAADIVLYFRNLKLDKAAEKSEA